MKDKPFLISSLVFGAVGLLLLIISSIVFITKNTTFFSDLGSALGVNPDTFTVSSVAQLATVCFVPSFIFSYKSMSDEEIN